MGFIDHWLHDPKIQRSKPSSSWWPRTILISHRISHHIQLCFLVSLWIHDEFRLVDLDARRPDAQVAGVCGSSKNWEGLCAKAVGCHCLWDIVTSGERRFLTGCLEYVKTQIGLVRSTSSNETEMIRNHVARNLNQLWRCSTFFVEERMNNPSSSNAFVSWLAGN